MGKFFSSLSTHLARHERIFYLSSSRKRVLASSIQTPEVFKKWSGTTPWD
jgi:hypothetical protein